MRFDIVTIFPEFFEGPLDYGIVRRAREAGLVDVAVHDLRGFTHDRHRTVDDRPFGGGEGMLLKPEPLFEAVESLLGGPAKDAAAAEAANVVGGLEKTAIVLLSASGKLFRQNIARRYAGFERIILLCGRYEGVDERVAEHLATEEVSIGDYVLTGGELPAALIVDAVPRFQSGAAGKEPSAIQESISDPELCRDVDAFRKTIPALGVEKVSKTYESLFAAIDRIGSRGMLECPHYTRPAEYRGWSLPEVLLGGNHEEIRLLRRQQALEKTHRNRPDPLGG